MSGWTTVRTDAGDVDCFNPSTAPATYAVLHLRDQRGPSPIGNPVLSAELERLQLRAFSPAFDGCWWVNVSCPAFAVDVPPLSWLQTAAVEHIARLWDIPSRQIGLLGTGSGGHGVLQLAYRFPREFPVVAAIAPAVDFHSHYDREPVLHAAFASAETVRQESATLRIHPMNWPPHQWFACDPFDPDWIEGCERLASKLSSIGIPFESDLTTSAGGGREDFERLMLPRALTFVADRLRNVAGTAT